MHPHFALLLLTLHASPARAVGATPVSAAARTAVPSPVALCDQADDSDGDDCGSDEPDEPLI